MILYKQINQKIGAFPYIILEKCTFTHTKII